MQAILTFPFVLVHDTSLPVGLLLPSSCIRASSVASSVSSIGAHIKTGAPRLHTTMQAILTFPLVLIRDTFMLMHSIPESLANDAVQTRQCNLDVPSRARSCHFLAPWIAAPIQSSTTAASRQSVAERQCTVGTKCIVLHWSRSRFSKTSAFNSLHRSQAVQSIQTICQSPPNSIDKPIIVEMNMFQAGWEACMHQFACSLQPDTQCPSSCPSEVRRCFLHTRLDNLDPSQHSALPLPSHIPDQKKGKRQVCSLTYMAAVGFSKMIQQ